MTMFPAEDDAGDERLPGPDADPASSGEATATLPEVDPASPGDATTTLPDAEPPPSAAAVAAPRKPAPSTFGDAFAALHDDGPQRHGAALRYSVELLAYYYAAQGRQNPAQEAIRTLVTDRYDILDTPRFGLYAPKGQGAAVADAGLRVMDALNAESVADPVWAGGGADSTEAQRRADYADQARGGRWVMDITGRHAILRDAQGRSVLAGSNISRVRLKGVPVVGFVMEQADQVQPLGDGLVGRAGSIAVEDRPAGDGGVTTGELDAVGDVQVREATQIAQVPTEPAATVDQQPPPLPRPNPRPGERLRDALWRAEQPGRSQPDYTAVATKRDGTRAEGNARGKYQMTDIALITAGYMTKDKKWTGSLPYRIRNEPQFLHNPAAQEDALLRYVVAQDSNLRKNGSLAYVGTEVRGIKGTFTITEAGLAAAAHRKGPPTVRAYLTHQEASGWRSNFSDLSKDEREDFEAIETRLRTFENVPRY